MNWNAIGALSELVGGLGVIITLVFLAFQIRHNARAVRNETLGALNAAMASNLMMFAQSSELSRILRSGLLDVRSLSSVDQFRFELGITTTLRHYETAFMAYERGLLAPHSWGGIEAMLLQLFKSEGVRLYWEARSIGFSEPFREHVQVKLTEAEVALLAAPARLLANSKKRAPARPRPPRNAPARAKAG